MLALLLGQAIRIDYGNRELLKDSALSLVMFTVSKQNCQACNYLEIMLNQINAELPIYILDCDANIKVCYKAEVQTVPLLAVFKGAQMVMEYEFGYTKQAIVYFAYRLNGLLFTTYPHDKHYFVVESNRPMAVFDDIFLFAKASAEFVFMEAEHEYFYAVREGVRIDYSGKIAKSKQLKEFVLQHNRPFIQRFTTRGMFDLYNGKFPLLLVIGRYVRDYQLLSQLREDMKRDFYFYSNVTVAFVDLQEYAVYTEVYGVNKRQNAVSLVVSNYSKAEYAKIVLHDDDLTAQVRALVVQIRDGKLYYTPFVENSGKQVKIGVGQSYTPPSETVGDRVLYVLDGLRHYDRSVWIAILASCGGMALATGALVLGISRL